MDPRKWWAGALAVATGLGIAMIAGTVRADPPCNVDRPNENAAFPCGVILYSPSGSVSSSVLAGMARGAGASVRHQFAIVSAASATIHSRSALQALAISSAQVIPDRTMRAIAKPGGGGGGGGTTDTEVLSEGFKRIGASTTGNVGIGVGVAIVDTGLDFNHADLQGAFGSGCHDSFGGTCQDQNGHGTHVGGIVAARDNSTGVVGVASGATLYAVRVLDASGSGSDSDVMAGLDWIYSQNTGGMKIRVANMSLGRDGTVNDNPAMHASVTRLSDQGVTIVVAAGNDPKMVISQQVPPAYPEVLAIASTTAIDGTNACNRLSSAIKADTASYFTTDGDGVVVSAPGEDREDVSRGCLISSTGILSLKLGGGTTRMSGTSMASPHVAGVAALLVAAGTSSPTCIRAKLANGASRQGTAPLNAPTSSYTFDGKREGIVSVPGALAATCP